MLCSIIFISIYLKNIFLLYIFQVTKFHTPVVIVQNTIPHTVGSKNANPTHFQLPVSFFIVSNVVVHGKCNKVNIITFIAVSNVHPFCIKICSMLNVFSKSTKLPLPI